LLFSQHFQNVARRNPAQGIESLLGKVQAVTPGDGLPRLPVQGHGVGQSAVAIKNNALYHGSRENFEFFAKPHGSRRGVSNFKFQVSNFKFGSSRPRLFELLVELIGHERTDERVEVAFDEIRQVVEGQFNAVIGHAVLREIISADLLAPFAGADLVFAVGGVFGIFLGDLAFEQASAGRRRLSWSLAANAGRRSARSGRSAWDDGTAESVVFTPWLPCRRRADVNLDLVGNLNVHLLRFGRTATVAVLVWMRPWASVAGTRWTR
jgi:hypothetical protein